MIMGSHKEWRKIAKRERRRRIRTRFARENDSIHGDSYLIQNWLKEQEVLENFEREQIEKSNREENEKWIQAEKAALEQWRKLQEKLEAIKKEHLVQQERQKMELELEQKKRADEEKRLKEVEKENIEKQRMFLKKLEQYLSGGVTEPPEELMNFHETKPSCEICPFFSKTACCRFGDQCSRNHQYPGISNVLLAPNFYVHFGLENANFNEYDTDVMLEYEDNDTYLEFKNFFYDVLPEFQKFGKITQFKVFNRDDDVLKVDRVIFCTYLEIQKICSTRRILADYPKVQRIHALGDGQSHRKWRCLKRKVAKNDVQTLPREIEKTAKKGNTRTKRDLQEEDLIGGKVKISALFWVSLCLHSLFLNKTVTNRTSQGLFIYSTTLILPIN